MLRILWGRSGSGKTEKILDEIARRAASGETGLIWLTPEPFSHECERMLALRGGPAVCLSAEVLTFSRLCDRVFAAGGGPAPKVLDEGGRLLTMRLAVDSVLARLQVWRRAARRADFLARLLNTLDECKCYGVTPEVLLEASRLAQGTSAQKIRELAEIFASYNGFTAQAGAAADPRDRMEIMRERLQNGDFLAGKRIFADGYVTFTPLECAVLDVCVSRALCVTLALTGTPGDAFFSVTRKTAERFSRHAGGAEITVLGENFRAESAAMRDIEKYAFVTLPQGEAPNPGQNVTAAICASPADELDFAAKTVREWTRAGLRYRDIAVILPQEGTYAALCEGAMERHAIPVFMDDMDEVASKPLARFIRAAADAEEYGFRQEDVLELLGTGLTRVPDARSGELENYIRLWKPDRRQWSDPQPWTLPPRGYGGAADDADARALRVVNAARVLLAAPFLRLRGASTALGWAKKFSEFLQSCRVPRALKRRAEALGRMGRRKLADESAQLWDIAVNALEQCAAVLGDRPMTRAQFAELYLLCVGAYSVGAIPAGLDRVSVGTAGRLRRLEVRAVLMLGCRAELMPRFAAPESLLAPEELSAIEGAGAEIPPKDEERYARARFDLYMAAALPSRFLCVTACPEANGKFLPAELFENICAVARIVPVQHSRAKRPPAAMDWLRAPLGEDAVEGLYGRDVYLSASRLESLMGCRQAFFLRYGLRAAPRRTESWTPLERGSFIHWVLEQTGRRFLGREISEIPESEIRAAAENAAMDYIETSLRGFKGQRKRFERSFAALTAAALEAADNVFAELKVSDFRPVAYELAFGGGGDMPAVQVGRTGRFSVRAGGKTDRVDVWQDPEGKRYIRAVDYKTGAAELDYTGLLYGFDIQLPLYLSALTDAWGDIPAGFLYVPAGSAPARSDRRLSEEDAAEQRDASRRRKGLVLDDGRVLRAMERSDDCRFIPVRYKKDGTPDARSGVISESQMRALSGHVRKTLEKAAEELTGGNVDASPAGGESRCERCDYRECCYFDSKRDVLRELTKADKKAFLAAIGGDDGGE